MNFDVGFFFRVTFHAPTVAYSSEYRDEMLSSWILATAISVILEVNCCDSILMLETGPFHVCVLVSTSHYTFYFGPNDPIFAGRRHRTNVLVLADMLDSSSKASAIPQQIGI